MKIQVSHKLIIFCGIKVIFKNHEEEPGLFDFSGKTILNVNDSVAGIDPFEWLLDKFHPNYIRAHDGAEAITICTQNHNIDLILMDLHMPIMDGLQTTEKIRKFNPVVPIIAITSAGFEIGAEHIKKVGCNDFLFKPINPQKLLKMIDHYLRMEHR
jgi:CheY-like chemotaxis protein